WFGYGTVRTQAEFEQKYAELITAIASSPTIAGFCYTQLTDTGQETNGLLTASRIPKLDPAIVRRITTQIAAAVPGDITAYQQQTQGMAPHSPIRPEGETLEGHRGILGAPGEQPAVERY
ncbi:MAG: glycoside hydrolase, partial [Chloroflexi bacterium]|nr:glycoside hydrolase [Chloroflexota bacterium]